MPTSIRLLQNISKKNSAVYQQVSGPVEGRQSVLIQAELTIDTLFSEILSPDAILRKTYPFVI
jgi:hypothetical protein